MDFILHGYQVNEPTWFYLSLLLIIAVFFRFGRIWSLRNLDLALMLSLAPALLYFETYPESGAWLLFVITGAILGRVLADNSFTRRAKHPQNLNAAGLAFLCVSAFAFLMTKVMTEPPPEAEVREVQRAQRMVQGEKPAPQETQTTAEAGPSSRLIYAAVAAARQQAPGETGRPRSSLDAAQYAARMMAMLAHMAVVLGLLVVARSHFGDVQLGLAMSTLYLLLPCTAYEVGRVNHVLPSALIVWSFAAYRRAWLTGALMGLACGTLFFPVFLLPIWIAFYGRNGGLKFCLSVAGITGLLVGSIWVTHGSLIGNTEFGFFDWTRLRFSDTETSGFWSVYPAAYRIPTFVCFLILVTLLALSPGRKNLGNLMAHTTAIIVATQFWYPQQGSVYVLWYLPMLLMVVFRTQMLHSVAPENSQVIRGGDQSYPPPSLTPGSASSITTTMFR